MIPAVPLLGPSPILMLQSERNPPSAASKSLLVKHESADSQVKLSPAFVKASSLFFLSPISSLTGFTVRVICFESGGLQPEAFTVIVAGPPLCVLFLFAFSVIFSLFP